MNEPSALLTGRGLARCYGRVRALQHVDLDVNAGQIHALLGANGAGKSTLVRIISGLDRPSAGTMQFQGKLYAPADKRAAEAAGVQIVQQELNILPTLSVAENLMLGRFPAWAGVIRPRRLMELSRQALNRVGLTDLDPATMASEIGVGHRQLIEIAAALQRRCRLLILDEPTAALSAAEVRHLFDQLRRLKQQGTAIIYISHRLDEIRSLADRITILRDGRDVGVWNSGQLSDAELVRRMTGEAESAAGRPFVSWRQSRTALRISGLSSGPVQNVSLTVNRGERLGIAGLVGSGRTELLQALFGAETASAGRVQVEGRTSDAPFGHPAEAAAAGMGLVPEDRRHSGLLLSESIRANMTLSTLRSFSSFGMVRRTDEAAAVKRMTVQTDIRCTDTEQPVRTLSGGNQQKVVVARWLLRNSDILLFDEPTRGIDVAARRRIHDLIASLAQNGCAILMVSSDTDELLDHCDRIAVLSAGRLAAVFERPNWSREQIMQAAFSEYGARTRPSGDLCSEGDHSE